MKATAGGLIVIVGCSQRKINFMLRLSFLLYLFPLGLPITTMYNLWAFVLLKYFFLRPTSENFSDLHPISKSAIWPFLFYNYFWAESLKILFDLRARSYRDKHIVKFSWWLDEKWIFTLQVHEIASKIKAHREKSSILIDARLIREHPSTTRDAVPL